jgi:hypothetical protein
MVNVVILDGKIHVESLETPQDGVSPIGAYARVSKHLDILCGGIGSAYIPPMSREK